MIPSSLFALVDETLRRYAADFSAAAETADSVWRLATFDAYPLGPGGTCVFRWVRVHLAHDADVTVTVAVSVDGTQVASRTMPLTGSSKGRPISVPFATKGERLSVEVTGAPVAFVAGSSGWTSGGAEVIDVDYSFAPLRDAPTGAS